MICTLTNFKKSSLVSTSLPLDLSYKQLYQLEFLWHLYMATANSSPSLHLDSSSFNLLITSLKNRSFQFSKDQLKDQDLLILLAFFLILEATYEPIFKDTSHGFRPNRSPRTAIKEICNWSGSPPPHSRWIIVGSIPPYYSASASQVIEKSIRQVWHDKNLLDLFRKFLHANLLICDFSFNDLGVPNYSKYPILSLLFNIYLHDLDLYMEKLISNGGPLLTSNEQRNRIWYNRYGNQFILGITGPLDFVHLIQKDVQLFLYSHYKISIPLLPSKKGNYLGYEIRCEGGAAAKDIEIRVPQDKLVEILVAQGYVWDKMNPRARTNWIYLQPHEIINRYNIVLQDLFNYYEGIVEKTDLFSYFMWVLKTSAVFTLSRKLNTSPKAIFKLYGPNILKVPRESWGLGRSRP